ncbi:MAG: sulfotransferase family protein [Candidatus Neomarinimicrobiota bacterium]
MAKKVFVKSKAPVLVRIYNFFLLFCGRIHFIKYEVDCFKYLKILSKEKAKKGNETSAKALNQFLDNIRSKSLNPATQIFISGELDRVFLNRAKVANIQNENPNLMNECFPDPIFIVGLPRTGTTALQNMFSFLETCRVLKLWELHYPTAHLEGEHAIKKAKNRTRKYAFLQNFSKPEQKYIHPVGVNEPDECFRLLFNSFTSIAISSALGLDDYENWVMESDMLNAYQEYKVQLQILSLNNQKTQLVVKAPEHLWNLNVLFKVFPSARIVMTHREPLQAIASYSSMISMFRRTAYKTTCFKDLGPYVTDVFQKGLKRSYKARKNKSDNTNIIDVHCKDIQNNPMTTLKSICRKLKINVDEKANETLNKWIKKRKNDSPGCHKYSYSTYGVSKSVVEKKFQFYNDKRYISN